MTIDRSAEVFTVVVCVDVLLPGFGSGVVLVTVAVLINTVPCATLAFTVATMVSVADAPEANVPMLQVGVVHVPTDGVALTKVRPAGRISLADTDCASLVPLLVTTTE